jgi:S1-C subfamily serine protease
VREDFWGNQSLQQLGDVIVSIDGKKTASTEDLQNALRDKKPGQTIDVEVLRQGARERIPVRLSERPADDR